MFPLSCRLAVFALLAAAPVLGCYPAFQRAPPGTSFAGAVHPAGGVRFLSDLTYTDSAGNRQTDHVIFDEVFALIGGAEHFIVVDMFLYNEFQGERPERTRALADELTQVLIARRRERPDLPITVISDPVNTVYRAVASEHFDALRAAGIHVVITRLEHLRDSNPWYSGLWRLLVRPLGSGGRNGILPSPFGDQLVTLRSYLALLNFKANHRKLVAVGTDSGSAAIVSSANPHDGSSAHGNVGLYFTGRSVADLVRTEAAVVAFSERGAARDALLASLERSAQLAESAVPVPHDVPADGERIQVVTEGKIFAALIDAIAQAGRGDEIGVAVFYLSETDIVDALLAAAARGVRVRVLLDPNKDAFGYRKGGVPNRPVAAQLHDGGIPVRWCDTHGEQCHAKMLLARYTSGAAVLIAGSANFTRRNLRDYNLETDVVVRGARDVGVFADAQAYFEAAWGNTAGRTFSADYEVFKDDSALKAIQKTVGEESGLSTF